MQVVSNTIWHWLTPSVLLLLANTTTPRSEFLLCGLSWCVTGICGVFQPGLIVATMIDDGGQQTPKKCKYTHHLHTPNMLPLRLTNRKHINTNTNVE